MSIIASTGLIRNKIACLSRVMDGAWWGASNASLREQPPAIFNGEYITGVNAAGTGVVNMIGVNSSNNVTLPSGTHLLTGQTLTADSGSTITVASGATLGLAGATVTGLASLASLATVTLSAAQIITLHSVPVALVASPGAGLALIPIMMLFEITTTSTGFTGGGVVAPVYHSATAALTANTVPVATVTAGAGTTYTLLSLGAPSNGLVLTANAGIDLYAASADFAAGTGTGKVQIWYVTVTL